MKMVSLVVPTYNEANNLPLFIEEIIGTIDKTKIDLEFIIIDDNSPDGTGKIAEDLSKKYPIKVIHRVSKLGLGSAVREGFKLSEREILGVMDADLSHDPCILNQLITSLDENDLVLGGRFENGSFVENWPVGRKMLSSVGVFLTKFLTGAKDPLSGYFFFKKDVIKDVNLQTKGYKILFEILVKGKVIKIKELPYKFRMRKFSISKLNYKEYILFTGQLCKYSMYKLWFWLKKNKDEAGCVAIFSLATTLLFYHLSSRAFWMDEQAVLEYLHKSQNPLIFLADYFRVPDNHPPLYYFLVILLYKIFPFGELGVRLLSVLSGLGIVVMVYYFTLLLYKNKALARWAMFLTSISSYFILISQMARYHSLSALLMLLSLYYFCKIILFGYDKKSFTLFIIFGILVSYTDLPHFIYLVFISNIYYFYSFFKINRIFSLRKWLGGQLVLGTFFLPIIYLFYLRIFNQGDGGFEKASLLGRSVLDWLTDFLMHFYAYFFGENILPWNWLPFMLGVCVLLFLFFIVIKNVYKKSFSREFYLLIYLFLSSVIFNTIFLNYANPRYNFIVYPKYVFVAFPLFIILITYLLFKIKKYYKYGLLGFVILVQVVGLLNLYQRQNYFNGSYFNDFRENQFVMNNSREGDFLIINGDMSIGTYNFYKNKYFKKVSIVLLDDLQELLNKERSLRVWFFSTGSDGDSAYPSATAQDKIPNGFKIIDEFHSVPIDPTLFKLKQKLIGRESYEYKYAVYLLTNK